MRILQFTAENFKKIRIVDISVKGRLTQITGKNGQGKTSVLDAIWALFGGKKAIPDRPVRKGADKSKLSATIGDDNGKPLLVARRTIAADRTTTLTIEAAPGAAKPIGTPQAVLDALIGEMSFDPLAFIQMEPDRQVERLRKLVKLDIDVDALNAENKIDFDQRTIVNREVKRLETELSVITVQQDLPKEKVNDAEILKAIQEVDAKNLEARKLDDAKREAERSLIEAREAIARATAGRDRVQENLADLEKEKARLVKELAKVDKEIEPLKTSHAKLRAEVEAMPAGEFADVMELTKQLQAAQVTNREIEKRDARTRLEEKLRTAQKQAADYTRAIEYREEQKTSALASAAMPLDGLTFTEEGVWFKGIPLTQLGEAEQLRVGMALSMAANPQLRAVPIHRGECLDADSLALIEKMAEEHDFQIFMASVDSSATVGIVLSDGMVEKDNRE